MPYGPLGTERVKEPPPPPAVINAFPHTHRTLSPSRSVPPVIQEGAGPFLRGLVLAFLQPAASRPFLAPPLFGLSDSRGKLAPWNAGRCSSMSVAEQPDPVPVRALKE